jgi:predicted nuclease of predicted toxin-antitoxin system
MILWLDAQLPPSLAAWIAAAFGVEARAVRDLGLRDAKDVPIFQAARAANAVVMTKDRDFIELLRRLGPPPKVLWVTCGNTSNARLRDILTRVLSAALALLARGEDLVEIGDEPPSPKAMEVE